MAETMERILTFCLSKDAVLSKNDPLEFRGLVAGSKGYLKVKVLAPDEFEDYAAAVVYSAEGKEYAVPLKGWLASVPNDTAAAKHFDVRVVLQKGEQRIFTNRIEVYQSGT